MTSAEIKEKASLICPNFMCDKGTKEANVDYILERLIMDYLHVHEKWVTNLAYCSHQGKQFAEDIFNKLALAEDKDAACIMLGKLVHSKNFIPFFPQHSFKDGMQYNFKKKDSIVRDICKSYVKEKDKTDSTHDTLHETVFDKISNAESKIKLLTENREYLCDENCTFASENEIGNLKSCLEKCSKTDYKSFREVIETFDFCTNEHSLNALYRLNKSPRNHPNECFYENSECNSEFVLMRKLGVHSCNVRKIYEKLNLIRKAHNILSDSDTALVLKDVDYLIKLTKYIPVVKSKVVTITERQSRIVNEEIIKGRFEDHYLDYVKAVKDLPQFTCISFEILVRPSEAKIISSRRKKLDNDKFTQLKQYLCSEQRESMGRDIIESIFNRYLCNYCNTKLNNNEIPSVSVINCFDAGKCPQGISKLNTFSLLLIKLASNFQTHLKLGPTYSKIPENQKMVGVRGNSIQLPIPIQNTIDELESNLANNRLLDINKHLIIYNKRNSNKETVFKNLVNVHNIKDALIWLKSHNRHYAHISIPSDPRELLPAQNVAILNEHIDDTNNCTDTVSTVDAFTEMITQDICDSEFDEMITQDVYYDSECDQMVTLDEYCDRECEEMVNLDEYCDSECEEMVTLDVYCESDVQCGVYANNSFIANSDGTLVTQDKYIASSDDAVNNGNSNVDPFRSDTVYDDISCNVNGIKVNNITIKPSKMSKEFDISEPTDTKLIDMILS